jgi:hypothetical protein
VGETSILAFHSEVALLAAPFASGTLDPVRLLAALVLPPLLTLAIAVGAVRIVGGLSTQPRTHAHGIVWGKRTFASRAAFGRWLDSQGRSYEAWARRHPAKASAATPKAERSAGHRSLLLGGIAVLGLGGLALLSRGRGRRPPLSRRPSLRRPRLGPSYARAQSATLLAWREHPDLAWYVAGGALAVGAGLLVAGWN